ALRAVLLAEPSSSPSHPPPRAATVRGRSSRQGRAGATMPRLTNSEARSRMRIPAWTGVLSVSMLLSLSAALPLVAQDKPKFRTRDIPRLMEEADKFIAADDLPKAAAYLKTIVELDPRQAQAAFKLGRVQEAQEDWSAMM